MKIIKNSDQKVIKSKTCGDLIQILESKSSPISFVLSRNLKPTKGYIHKKSYEYYYVISGNLTIDVVGVDGVKKRVLLNEGELLEIEPDEFHEVVQSSEENEVAVICNPPWSSEDQYLL